MIAVEETCCCGSAIRLDDLLTYSERDRHLKGWREQHHACVPPLPTVGRCGDTIEPLAPGVSRLSCDLPTGHEGEHGDRDGAWWSRDGQWWQAG